MIRFDVSGECVPRLYNMDYILGIYSFWDLSENLYQNVCEAIKSNQHSLVRYKNLNFRDLDTKVLFIYETRYLIRQLNNLKLFLENNITHIFD